MAEAVIKTLRGKIQRYLTYHNSKRYLDALPSIVSSYNDTIHSRTGIAPRLVNESNQLEIWHRNFGDFFKKNKKQKQKFHINDFVRILLNKSIFEKGSNKTYSNSIYTIAEVINSIPIMYKLKDKDGIVQGSFYNNELIKVPI